MQKARQRDAGPAGGSKQIASPLPHPHCGSPTSEQGFPGPIDCPEAGYLFLSSPLPLKEIKDRPSDSRFLGLSPLSPDRKFFRLSLHDPWAALAPG